MFKDKILTEVIVIVTVCIIAYIFGYYLGYQDISLNFNNAKIWCETNGDILCSFNSEEIVCGDGGCYKEYSKTVYTNPELKIKNFIFAENQRGGQN